MKARKRKGLIRHIRDITISAFAIIGLIFCLNSFAQNVDELKFFKILGKRFGMIVLAREFSARLVNGG